MITIRRWNRNGYEYDLERDIQARLENCTSFAYLIADINGLKATNDSQGHIEGDKLIELNAQILQKELASAYKLYRVGGDEFVALYFDKDIAAVAAEAARAEELSRQHSQGGLPTGLSIGYADREGRETLTETMKRAERMMYESKRSYYREKGFEQRKV